MKKLAIFAEPIPCPAGAADTAGVPGSTAKLPVSFMAYWKNGGYGNWSNSDTRWKNSDGWSNSDTRWKNGGFGQWSNSDTNWKNSGGWSNSDTNWKNSGGWSNSDSSGK